MASIQQPSSSSSSALPAVQAARAVQGRAANYARQHLLVGRSDSSSPAPTKPRSSNNPNVRRAQFSSDGVQLSSSYTGGSYLRNYRQSSHGATEYASSSKSSGLGATVAGGLGSQAVPLSRHQSIQSQPYGSRTPGPMMPSVRARLHARSNGTRPTATPSSLSQTLSISSATTSSPSRGSLSASVGATLAAAAAALPPDDVLCKIFGSCLPTVFEALAKYQYQQATNVLDAFIAEQDVAAESGLQDVRTEWKSWTAFAVMVRLAASCESTYHLMRYMEPDMIHKETLDQLYNKLVVLLKHLVEEIAPVVRRAQQRSGGGLRRTPPMNTPASVKGGHGSVYSITSDSALMSELDQLMADDLEYYQTLLEQAADFFALRVSMIGLYRGLATQPSPQNYPGMAKTLERLMKRYSQFEHPLLVTLRQSTIEELRTVKAAFDSEVCLSQYDFTKSMLALHRFKSSLRMWSDHIDSVSDYPLFDESDDEDDYMLSSSTYSDASVGSSTVQMQQQAAAAAAMLYADAGNNRYGSGGPVDSMAPPPLTNSGSLARPQRESSLRRKSFNQSVASSSEMAAFAAASEQAAAATAAANAAESQNAFSRLLAQRGSLLKRGLSVSSLRSKIQAAAASLQPSTTPTNALENAILGTTPLLINGGGIANSMLTPGGNGLSSVGTNAGGGGTSGFNTTNAHTIAAEMMASAVAKQEREDGYALPVYQWSKRFCRSLVAKFTLYFHTWLEPFESRGDVLAPYNLTRFIRSPVGISYLQLIDVLLAKGSHRVEDGTASVMLIVETDKLDNKGARFYAKGYFCPQSSKQASKTVEASDVSAKTQATTKQASRSVAPGSVGRMAGPPLQSSSASPSPSSTSQSHNLFNLNLEPEAEEDESGDFAPLWGLRGWPAVFCYPNPEPPLEHWPNLVSLIMDNRQVLEVQSGRAPFVHTERRLKTSYYISSIDPAVYLVLLLEGKRRPTEKTAQDFMQTMTENLQHCGVYRRGGTASSRGG